MSKRKKQGRTRSQAEIRAAAAERRSAVHARLVLDRKADPDYVQQQRTSDGRVLSWAGDSQVGAEMQSTLEHNRQAFIEKFGREPRPEDPIFFDPDEDEPTPLTPDKEHALFHRAMQAALDAGMHPAHVGAWSELGYIVTEQNQHLFLAVEVQAFHDAVDRIDPSSG